MDSAYTIEILQKQFQTFTPTEFIFTESLNEPFCGLLSVISKNLFLGSQLTYKRITCIISHNKEKRIYNGIITAVQREPYEHHHKLQLFIKPDLSNLGRDQHYRIFTNKNPLEIAESILADYSITYKKSISKNFPKIKLYIQYNESSLNFLHRLFATYGLYYHFEHTDKYHIMHISDRITNPIKNNNLKTYAAVILKQTYIKKIGPTVTSSDRYQAELPYTPVKFIAQGNSRTRRICKYTYPHQGENQQQVSFIQAIEATRLEQIKIWHLSSSNHLVTTGNNIKNNNEVIIVYVKHEYYFNQPSSQGHQEIKTAYHNTIKAIPSTTQHYDCKNYTQPLAAGIQIARTSTVKSPTPISENAAIKIIFFWDEKQSVWVRSSHVYSGQNHGALTPYRNNSTTVIQYLNNNPNTPVAIGQLYTKDQINTFKHSSKFTSGIKTKSLSDENPERYHQLCFNDEAGKESINLTSGRNQIENICNDYLLDSKMDLRHSILTGDQRISINSGYNLISAKQISLNCGSSTIVIDKSGVHFNATKVTLNTGAAATHPVARQGDEHTCPKYTGGIIPHQGGKIMNGSSDVFVNNKPVARHLDALKCNTSNTKISSGNEQVLINGKPLARVSDKTLHKGKIKNGSENVYS